MTSRRTGVRRTKLSERLVMAGARHGMQHTNGGAPEAGNDIRICLKLTAIKTHRGAVSHFLHYIWPPACRGHLFCAEQTGRISAL